MSEPIWVIEMKDGRAWKPCADAFLSRSDARGYNGLQHWKENCPNDKFRISKYVRAATKRGENGG